jgi:hypothetical protein
MTMTEITSRLGSRLWLVCLPLTAACTDSLAIPNANITPIADARIVGSDSHSPSVDFSGSKVAVTLDATHSHDADGSIATYRWLSSTLPPGRMATAPAPGNAGSGGGMSAAGMSAAGMSAAPAAGSSAEGSRWIPTGQEPGWPEDVAQPTVMLDEGVWSFTLWVIDNHGKISDPSTVTITVSPPLDPAVKACVDTVVSSVKRTCATCVCGVSDTCRAAANMSMCDASCWGLLNCIGSKCPTFAMTMDAGCVISNCSMYLGGMTGATAIGPCVVPACTSQCSAD